MITTPTIDKNCKENKDHEAKIDVFSLNKRKGVHYKQWQTTTKKKSAKKRRREKDPKTKPWPWE